MKFICIADIHMSLYSQDPIIQGCPMRLYYINESLISIANYALLNKIKTIVIAGDVFHTKSIIHSIAQSMLLDYIRRFDDLDFIIIDGNHDMSSKSGDGVSALKCLDNEPNVIMVHETEVIENTIFVPWHPKKMKADIKASKQEYLVSHFGINEAILNSGISIVSDIGLKDLAHFKNCFIGHYHMPQNVGNVYVPGSIIQLDWGEKGEEKRFLVVDTKAHTVDSIELAPLTGYKKHLEFKVTATNAAEVYKEAIEMKKQGHFIKILKTEEASTTIFGDEFHIVDKTEKDITNRGIDTSMSTRDKLFKYMEIKEIPEDEREEYFKIASEIIEETHNG